MPITPPDYSTANTDTTTNQDDLEAAALAIWVAESTTIINNNIQLGLFQCFLDVPNTVVVSQAIDYFQNLGYFVNILQQEVVNLSPQFFGQIAGLGIPQVQQLQLQTRLVVSWSSNPPNGVYDIVLTNYP